MAMIYRLSGVRKGRCVYPWMRLSSCARILTAEKKPLIERQTAPLLQVATLCIRLDAEIAVLLSQSQLAVEL